MRNGKHICLDLFCGAGGASMGYHKAGFEVIGVDIEHQKRYPFEFINCCSIEYKIPDYVDFVAASPPCQAHSIASIKHKKYKEYKCFIEETREKLIESRKLYAIENVPGAPLRNYFCLTGQMFGLKVIRKRIFESNFLVLTPTGFRPRRGSTKTNNGKKQISHENGAEYITVVGNKFNLQDGKKAMGIDWMTKKEITQAIPPAYTELIGRSAIRILEGG